jgi:hypothetical protein
MPQVCGPSERWKRSDVNGMAISTVYPVSSILPAELQMASQAASSSSSVAVSSSERSICTPRGFTKSSTPRRSSLNVSSISPTKSSRNGVSRSARWARIALGSGSSAWKAA